MNPSSYGMQEKIQYFRGFSFHFWAADMIWERARFVL